MHPNSKMYRIVKGKKYSIAAAVLIASDEYWDGQNWERRGRNQFLYRTKAGNYFTVYLSQWQGEQDNLTPCTQAEAIEMYEDNLREHEVPYTEAFPDVPVTDA